MLIKSELFIKILGVVGFEPTHRRYPKTVALPLGYTLKIYAYLFKI